MVPLSMTGMNKKSLVEKFTRNVHKTTGRPEKQNLDPNDTHMGQKLVLR